MGEDPAINDHGQVRLAGLHVIKVGVTRFEVSHWEFYPIIIN